MKPFRTTKSARGFKTTLTGFEPCDEMITRVTWDNKGCTVSIQCGGVQFTTDFTQILKEMLIHDNRIKRISEEERHDA